MSVNRGFVRITSNSAFSRDAAAPYEAISLLAENANKTKHVFWPAAISYADPVAQYDANLVRHQQITDAYLLGLAIHNGGRLATFDRTIASLLPPSSAHSDSMELIRS